MESTVVKIARRLSNLILAALLAGFLALLTWRLFAGRGDTPVGNPFIASPAAAKIVAPSLVDPLNPLDFGAKCDGATDDSAAFQAALDAGDVKVPAGTCVIDRTVKITVSK